MFAIAIDGPAGAGKQRREGGGRALGFIYADRARCTARWRSCCARG